MHVTAANADASVALRTCGGQFPHLDRTRDRQFRNCAALVFAPASVSFRTCGVFLSHPRSSAPHLRGSCLRTCDRQFRTCARSCLRTCDRQFRTCEALVCAPAIVSSAPAGFLPSHLRSSVPHLRGSCPRTCDRQFRTCEALICAPTRAVF